MSNKGSAIAEVVSRWCQCENAGCSKWRRLPPGTEVDDSQPWFCYMNPDELRNSCEAPEESYNEDVEEDAAGLTDDEASPATRASAMPGRPSSGRGRGRKRGGRGHSRGRGRGRGRGRASKADTASSPPWLGGGKRPRVKEEEPQDVLQGPKRRQTMSLSDEGLAQPDAEQERYSVEPANGLLHNQPQKQLEPPAQPQTAAPLARGTAKARKAHKGFEKLLSAAGVWEVAKGKGRAVLVPPQWIWEGFAQFAPDAAEVACNALDMLSAARYFDSGGASTATAKPGIDEVQSSARLAVMMASAAAADSAAGSLAASVAPAAPQPSAFSPAARPSFTAAALPASQSPVMPPGTHASASARTPLPPASWSPVAIPPAAFPPAGTLPLGQQSVPLSLQLPKGLGSSALGPRSPAVHSSGRFLHLSAALPPPPMAGTPSNSARPTPQLPPVAAQAAALTGPALPQPLGPHSGAHWRPFRESRATAPDPQQPLQALSIQPPVSSGLAVPGSMGSLSRPGQPQSCGAQGNHAVAAAGAAAAQSSMVPSETSFAGRNGCKEQVDSSIANGEQSLQDAARPYKLTEVPVSNTLVAHELYASHAVNAYANGSETVALVPNESS